jgi:pimeloyl-ACP methyl ester carboxylesterase
MLADHVALISNTIDQMGGPVALVGHAEACGLVHAAVNRRPDRVARVFHVGGLPSADGTYVLTGFAADSHHGTAEIARRCAADEALAALRERQRTGDGQGIDTPQRLTDERRYEVPATVITTEYTTDDVRRWMAEEADPAVELTRIRQVSLVDLPAGHWPQFECGAQLTRIIVDALADDARSAA